MSQITIKYIEDKQGNKIAPITHMNAVRDDNGNPITDYLGGNEIQIGGNTPSDPEIKLYVDESADGYGAFQLSTNETTGTDTFVAIGAATIVNNVITGTDTFTF